MANVAADHERVTEEDVLGFLRRNLM